VNVGSSSSSTSPFIIRMNASMPTALTSGSAKGSSISGFGPLDAIARRAATVAVIACCLGMRHGDDSYLRVAVTEMMLRIEVIASSVGHVRP